MRPRLWPSTFLFTKAGNQLDLAVICQLLPYLKPQRFVVQKSRGCSIFFLLLLLLLSHFSCVRLCATPWTTAYQAPPSMGFSRQEYWGRVPLPSMLLCAVILKFFVRLTVFLKCCQEPFQSCFCS